MSRRKLLHAFVMVVVTLCLLVLPGTLSAQGNSEEAFARVQEVQQRHTNELMARAGVVGTAVSLGEDGNPAVLVLLEHGAVAGIPAQLDGIKVDKMVTGKIQALADTAKYDRPVPIGVSTGHFNITAGTIGCRVKDASGNVYALSNNHVYANENGASNGDNVLQPGPVDGGVNPGDAIGTLHDYEPIDFSGTNTIDAAIALTTTAQVGTATPAGGYGAPRSTPVAPRLRMQVQKRGRTTGLTVGTIKAVNATINVGYDTGVAQFVNQIVISPAGFSAGGDSGSLIVTQADNSPVGLLFAGSSSVTIANRIDLVLARFGVTIDGAEGTTNSPPTVSITSPANGSTFNSGTSVTFAGAASDTEDGDLSTSMIWTSSRDGQIGTGSTFSRVLSDGVHAITATVTDSGGATASDSVTVTVTAPSTGPTVTGISPNTLKAGTSINATITGTGFLSGAKVTFENGAGPVPSASSVQVVNATSITATVKVKNGGPSGIRTWDVRVTNPNGSSAVLARSFTVTR